MGSNPQRRLRRVLAATTMFGMVGGSLATMGTAHAAVTISGTTIDSAGNYVDGFLSIYKYSDKDGDGTIEPFEYDFSSASVTGGAFDLALADGIYKLAFDPYDSEYVREYYLNKADLTSADAITVAGAGQTLPTWTIDSTPTVTGVVTTADGRPVRGASVTAYAADDGTPIAQDATDASGAFRIGTTENVKLEFEGEDPVTGRDLASEFYNDKTDLASADVVAPGANVGTVSLAPGGSIAGRITNEAGAPLYRALACTDGGRCDHTDANGAYLIEDVTTGSHDVRFTDPIGEYAGEYFNNVPVNNNGFPIGDPTAVVVAPGQAVTGIDAALASANKPAPTGVDLSGIVRDQVGGVGVGYSVVAYNTPANPDDAEIVASTISDRAGGYAFTTLDRIGGETEFKIAVVGEQAREDGDFARRTIWSGQKYGYDTAAAVTAAPQVIDFVQPVAGGIAGAVTSEAGGAPQDAFVSFYDADGDTSNLFVEFKPDGSYETRNLWAGEYKAQFSGDRHVAEWWDDARFEDAKTITVEPGKVVTGISGALSKTVKAVERPEINGDAWVGKTLRLDKGVWTSMADSQFTYEWLVNGKVVATTPTLKLSKGNLGDKVVGRVTNDLGFTQGQAVTKSTAKVGYKPKLKAKVSAKRIAVSLKVKPLKSKKVKASVVVYEVKGKKANGELKLKKIGKAKIKKATGVVKLKKALGKGKHKLVFRIKGKGKVGSGDLMKTVKIKR